MFGNLKNGITIALDFDGTVVTHEYPRIGEDIGAIPVLKKIIQNGNRIVLNTMRSGDELNESIEWFNTNGIELYGVGYNPTQSSWTTSNKCYAELYIDDAALGAPLSIDKRYGRPFINWVIVEEMLVKMGVIN
jgi:hypothetical protein